MQTNDSVLTVAQLAEELQVAPKTIYRLCARGLIKRVRGLRVIRVTRVSLDAFLDAKTS
jgi:DeoR/GlpR family transcriptional regulator of sugar metabolism